MGTILFFLPIKYYRFLLFSFVGGISALLGALLLYCFVELGDIDKDWAYFTQLVLVLQVNFNLNDVITWGNNRNKDNYARRWTRFHIGRSLSLIGSQAFFMLATEMNVPYLVAYVADSILWLAVNYLWGKGVFKTNINVETKSVFQSEKPKT